MNWGAFETRFQTWSRGPALAVIAALIALLALTCWSPASGPAPKVRTTAAQHSDLKLYRDIIARVRRNGFAERSPAVEPRSSNTFSVPIQFKGDVLATIGVTYFNSSMPKAKAISSYVPRLLDLARNIESSVQSLHAEFTAGETRAGGAKDDGKQTFAAH